MSAKDRYPPGSNRDLRFWEEEVDDRDEDSTPADDYQEVLPPNLSEANWCCLEQDYGRRELAEQRESHANRSNLSREYLRYPEVHGCVAAGSLESQIKEDEEDSEAVAHLV